MADVASGLRQDSNTCLIKARMILCYLKDACPLYPPSHAFSHLPPFSLWSSRALENEGNSLYLKASSDIMEKADSQSGVGRESKEILLRSQDSKILSKLDLS